MASRDIDQRAALEAMGMGDLPMGDLTRHMGTFGIETNDPKLRRKMNVTEGNRVAGDMQVITDDTGKHQTIGRFLGVNAGDNHPVHEAWLTEPNGNMYKVPLSRLSDADAERAVRSETNPKNLPTPESRIRSVRNGATIRAPQAAAPAPQISTEDAEARYRAAGMSADAARTVAQAEARIHGPGAQAIWGQSPSPESLERVRNVEASHASIDRMADDA